MAFFAILSAEICAVLRLRKIAQVFDFIKDDLGLKGTPRVPAREAQNLGGKIND